MTTKRTTTKHGAKGRRVPARPVTLNPAAGWLTDAEWRDTPPLARAWVLVAMKLFPAARSYDAAIRAERVAAQTHARIRKRKGRAGAAFEAWRQSTDVTINARRELADLARLLLTGSKGQRCGALIEFVGELLGLPPGEAAEALGASVDGVRKGAPRG